MSSKTIIIVVAIIAVLAVAVLAFSIFKPAQEASAPIEAVPITQEEAATAETSGNEAVAEPTEAPAEAPSAEPTVAAAEEVKAVAVDEDGFPQIESPLQTPAAESPLPTPPAESAAPAEEPAAPAAAAESPASSGPVVFTIVPAESQARFRIREVLRGEDKEVVGTTDQVAGEISIDVANPAASQVGTIRVNARTLTTDNNFRNNAIKNRILLTNDHEFVEFTPTAIQGMPDAVVVGEPVTFQIIGDLTVTDETNEVVFDVTVTPVSNERLEGLAVVTIAWRDFGLLIPDAPAVDTVADEVTLELQFVAVPKGS